MPELTRQRTTDSLPWHEPFRDWLDDELLDGLDACDEFKWDNLRRQIEAEQTIRLAEEQAA